MLQGATNRSFKKKSQPSTAFPYLDITTRRRAQNQARPDRRNAEGDAGRERHGLRQAAARADRRYAVTPAGLLCCIKSSLQPTYMHTHTHTHTHTHQATLPALLPSSLFAPSRRLGLLMPPPGRLNDSNAAERDKTPKGPQPGDRASLTC